MYDQLKPKPVMKSTNDNSGKDKPSTRSSSYYNPHRKTITHALENHLPVDICVGGRWFYGAEIVSCNDQEGWVEVKTTFSESETDDNTMYCFAIGTLSLRSITALFIRDNQTLFNPAKHIEIVKDQQVNE